MLCISACIEKNQKPIVTGMESQPLVPLSIMLADSVSFFNTERFLSGKSLILFYYSPTCPYCRAQMRELLNNIDKLKSTQLCVLTAADFSSMREFNNYFKLDSYPSIVSGKDIENAFLQKYKIAAVPFTAVFDKNMRLTSAFVGRVSSETLLKAANL